MKRSAEVNRNNNDVLERLWNDPQVRELTSTVKDTLPSWKIAEEELLVDYDHLMEAGYIGTPPYFHIRIGRFMIYGAVDRYEDYWIRVKLPRGPHNTVYSLFKET
jgi:hypothetical protein